MNRQCTGVVSLHVGEIKSTFVAEMFENVVTIGYRIIFVAVLKPFSQ